MKIKCVFVFVLLSIGTLFFGQEKNDLEKKISGAIKKMAEASPVYRDLNVSIGEFTFNTSNKSSGVSSSFSDYLQYEVNGATSKNFRSVKPRSKGLDLGIVSKQDNRVYYKIEGSYMKVGKDVTIQLKLVSQKGNNTTELITESFKVPVDLIEKELELSLLPPNYQTEEELKKDEKAIEQFVNVKNDFNLKILNDKNIYYDGDEMSFDVFSDTDCYIKVYHIDVDGNRQLIFPLGGVSNFIKANTVITLPQEGIVFNMVEPYGAETILVSASDVFIPVNDNDGEINIKSKGMNVKVDEKLMKSKKKATTEFRYTILEKRN